MFITGLNRYTKPYNISILDYCTKSTQESIRKITERKKIEKENKFVNFKLDDDSDGDNDNNNKQIKFTYYNLLVFLYISSIGIYFYKKLK